MPCTLAYHKQGMGWGKILKSFSKSYKVDSGNCGLHIHRSKDDLNIKDMCFIAKLMSNNIKYFAQRVGRVSYKGIYEYAKAFTYLDSSYKNIIDNQLGNVIVTKDIDSMNLIAKILELKQSQFPAFIDYQFNQVKNPEIWICKLDNGIR